MSIASGAKKRLTIAQHLLIYFLLLGPLLVCLEIILFCLVVPLIISLGLPVPYKRPFIDLALTMGAGLVLSLVGGVVLSIFLQKKGVKYPGLHVLPLLSLIMLLSMLAALPWIFQDTSRQIDLSTTGFSQSTLTIDDAQDVHLHNSSSRFSQIVCLGAQRHCQPDDFGPKQLQPPGLSLSPGQTITFTFPKSGTFLLTIPTADVHTELTVTVGENCLYVDVCGSDD